MDHEIITNNIKALMRKRNETQAALAKKINMDPTRLSRIMTGNSSFTLEQLIQISQHYNVSLDFLVGNKNRISTVADVLNLLFRLDENTKLHVHRDGITFVNNDIKNVLGEWARLQLVSADANMLSFIRSAWKEYQIAKYEETLLEE